MNPWLLAFSILYPTTGLIFGLFLLFMDKAMHFDAASQSWQAIFTDYRTWLILLLALILWPIALVVFVISMIP